MDDDCAGIDEMGDGWTGEAGVWRWRVMAGVACDGDDGFSWWVAEDGAGADGVMAEDEAGTGVDGIGGWGMSATAAVWVDWDDDEDDEDDDGSCSVTPLLLQRVVPAWYLMPTLAYSCQSWSSLA